MASIYVFERNISALETALIAAVPKVVKVTLRGNHDVVVETNADLNLAEQGIVSRVILETMPRLRQEKVDPGDPVPPPPAPVPPPKNIAIAALTGSNKYNINCTPLGVVITNPLV